jgi:hypothetical protein
MRKLKRDDDDDGGLDSLLDTMTNVVGILVLVLVMTQLSVSEAINEITENSNVTQEDVDLAKEKLSSLAEDKQELEEQTETLASFDLEAERERLERLKKTLAARRKLLADQAKESNQFTLAIQRDRKTAASNKKAIEDTKKNREGLQSKLEKSLEERAKLQAMLDKTPRRTGPAPAKVVTIPNPRPAPPGARRLVFVCSGNRLYPMNLDGIRKEIELRSKQIIVKQRLNLDPKAGIDPEKFAKLYLKLKLASDDFFSVDFHIAGNRWPQIKLTPKAGRGADEKELRRSTSRIRKLMAQIDPKKFYALFYVLPDSYDVYLTARQVLSDAGVLAGWNPQSATWAYSTGIGGGIELGAPRPPNPNPPPTTPSKPANVID